MTAAALMADAKAIARRGNWKRGGVPNMAVSPSVLAKRAVHDAQLLAAIEAGAGTAAEIAAGTGRCWETARDTIYRLMASGRIKAVQVGGGKVRYEVVE